jgi:putative transcriptional regulator
MPIIINLDVMLCEKMRSNELADRMGITTANLIKTEKQRRSVLDFRTDL